MHIGFVGLGNLGLQLAHNLLDAGHTLTVWNRTAEKAAPLVSKGATLVARPADVATAGGLVVTVLFDGPSVEEVIGSEGFLSNLATGAHISVSTITPEAARRVASMHERAGSTYIEAPVFGRPEAAKARKLIFAISGAARDRARPVLEAMGAASIHDFGDAPGTAVAVKLAGNFMIGSAARTMSEALTVATKSGANPAAFISMLTSTLFAAPIYQSYGKALLDGIAPAQSDIVVKDLNAFLDTAKTVDAPHDVSSRLVELLHR